MIDWFLAERLAALVAGSSDAPAPRLDLAELARESELRVTEYTRMTPTVALPKPEGVDRREWVHANAGSLRSLLDPVLSRADSARGLRGGARLAAAAMVTAEVGVVLGYLAQRVMGQYELVLLDEADPSPPRLLFVLENLGQAVRSFGAREEEFVTWVALHEVTHAVQFAAVGWLRGHLAGLVSQLLQSAQLRIERRRSMRLPTAAELRRAGRAALHGDLISIVATAGERETIDRVQATMAVIEGHAEHVMDAVAPDLIPSLPQLRAALDRRRRSQSAAARLLGRLLGLELKMRQYRQGKAFFDAIVAAGGGEAMAHVFSSPEALPTLAELTDPPAWLVRVGLDGRDAGER
ncbi:MAG TPA: zinc-dependent metalloprotease [Solirubrobacteraceae bacterium]|nr:zinc-dependent metalloprotease [Solirubrobacteraceae bacterium]